MYMCYFRVVPSDPNGFGAPQIVAQTLANTLINPTAPSGCTNNPAEPWCFGTEGITQACARHPAVYTHFCTVPQPPRPILTPIVWVQEAERCDPNVTLSEEQQEALLDLVRPQAPGLVVSFAALRCRWQQGGAFYQVTLRIAAGSSLDIFTGSAKIVDWIEARRVSVSCWWWWCWVQRS